jgi:uncharacterized protein
VAGLWGLLGIAGTVYLAAVGALYVFQRHVMYLPSHERPVPAAWGVPDMDVVRLGTDDGLDLDAWYRPPPQHQATLVYLHGNGGHIGHRAARARTLIDAGLGVLLVEYRGYGGNPGMPTEAGLLADGRAAMAFLADQGVAPADTVLFGESLGSGVAVRLAAEMAAAGRPVGGVVLEAPFTSAADVGARHHPWAPVRLLIKDRYDSTSRIARIGAPLFVYHGDADRVVPQRLGRELFAAAVEPKQAWWIVGGGHADLDAFAAMERVSAWIAALPGD